MKFKMGKSKRGRAKTLFVITTVVIILLLVASAVVVRRSYTENLQPLSATSKTHVVTIQPGMTTAEVADLLHAKEIIKSDWAFEWYVRNHQTKDDIKAGTYVLDQNQSVSQIVKVLVSGKVATDLVTILPAQRLDQIKYNLPG
jgi:UPF0755 protein